MDDEGDSTVKSSDLRAQMGQTNFVNRLLVHDLTNHLLVIEGTARLLDESLDDSHASQRVETILRQTQASSSLISNAKAILNGTSEEPREIINVGSVLESEVNHIEAAYPAANISVEVTDAAKVRASPLLGSVFSNLLRNAIVHNDQQEPEIDVSLGVDGGTATVSIEDDGPGIPPDVLNNLTNLSTRNDDGLGLYIVNSLVESFDDDFSVDTDDTGTTVSVSFPLASDQTQ